MDHINLSKTKYFRLLMKIESYRQVRTRDQAIGECDSLSFWRSQKSQSLWLEYSRNSKKWLTPPVWLLEKWLWCQPCGVGIWQIDRVPVALVRLFQLFPTFCPSQNNPVFCKLIFWFLFHYLFINCQAPSQPSTPCPLQVNLTHLRVECTTELVLVVASADNNKLMAVP